MNGAIGFGEKYGTFFVLGQHNKFRWNHCDISV